jgi:hypothetical protein
MQDIIDKLLDLGENHVRNILLKMRQPELAPFYHLVSGSNSPDIIIACQFSNEFEKKMTFLAVKQKANEIKATAGMFVAESWMLTVTTESQEVLDQLPSLSQHPDRVEVVMLIATTGRETRSRTLRIVRGEDEGITDLIDDSQALPGIISGTMIDGLIEPVKLHS